MISAPSVGRGTVNWAVVIAVDFVVVPRVSRVYSVSHGELAEILPKLWCGERRTNGIFGGEHGQPELGHAPHKLRPRIPNASFGPPGYGRRTPLLKVFHDWMRY